MLAHRIAMMMPVLLPIYAGARRARNGNAFSCRHDCLTRARRGDMSTDDAASQTGASAARAFHGEIYSRRTPKMAIGAQPIFIARSRRSRDGRRRCRFFFSPLPSILRLIKRASFLAVANDGSAPILTAADATGVLGPE